MKTSEQHAAFESLRSAVKGYRVVADIEGWPMVPGRYGRIEYHDGRSLAVYTDRPRMIPKLAVVAGVRRHQIGDSEARLMFPVTALAGVARLIRARRKRSATAAAHLADHAYRATSATVLPFRRQDPTADPVLS